MENLSKDMVLVNLEEALQAIEQTIKDMKNDSEYSEGELYISINHIYDHINTAWNIRYASSDDFEDENNYDLWRQFPNDMDMS